MLQSLDDSSFFLTIFTFGALAAAGAADRTTSTCSAGTAIKAVKDQQKWGHVMCVCKKKINNDK